MHIFVLIFKVPNTNPPLKPYHNLSSCSLLKKTLDFQLLLNISISRNALKVIDRLTNQKNITLFEKV